MTVKQERGNRKKKLNKKYFGKLRNPDVLEALWNREYLEELDAIYKEFPLLDSKGKEKKNRYNNPYIFAFDIETSKTSNDPFNRVQVLDPDRSTRTTKRYKDFAFMHQFTISALRTKDGKLFHVYAGNYIEELFEFFDRLLMLPYETRVFSHNYGGYESHLINQYPYMEEHTESILASSPSKVITQRLHTNEHYGQVQISDTLLILQKSIKTLGEELDFPKLSYDYNEFRLPNELFTIKDIEYCFRDNDISLLALYNKCKLYPWLWKNEKSWMNSKKITVSSTGFVRKELKENPEINKDGLYKDWCDQCKQQFITDPELYYTITQSFNGGYVHANPYFVGKPIKNVISVDFKSDYPGQMLNRDYPHNAFSEIDVSEFDLVVRPKLEYYCKNWRDAISARHLLPDHYLGCFEFKNIRFKEFQNKNVFPIIASSKSKSKISNFDLISKSTILDNGKLLYSDVYIAFFSEVELLSLMLTYDFDEMICHSLYKSNESSPMHSLIQNAIIYYGKMKEVYKECVKRLENNKSIDDLEIPKAEKQTILKSDVPLNVAKDYLQNAKAQLNGLYGQQTQKPLQDEYCIREGEIIARQKTLEEVKEELPHKVINHSFSVGVYVTSWARLSLVLGFYEIIANGGTFIYCDTDSIKFITNGFRENIINGIQEYNDNCITNNDNIYKFGVFDFEIVEGQNYSYRNFCTLGAKKYLCEEFNSKENKWEISSTIAGLPKDCCKIWQELEKECSDFNDLVENYFHHNILIDKSLTGKMTHTEIYSGEDMREYLPDIGGELPIKSMTLLIEAPFDMNSCILSSSSTNYYCSVLEKLFDNPQNNKRRMINNVHFHA